MLRTTCEPRDNLTTPKTLSENFKSKYNAVSRAYHTTCDLALAMQCLELMLSVRLLSHPILKVRANMKALLAREELNFYIQELKTTQINYWTNVATVYIIPLYKTAFNESLTSNSSPASY